MSMWMQAPQAEFEHNRRRTLEAVRESDSSPLGWIRAYMSDDDVLTFSAVSPTARVLAELVPSKDIPFYHPTHMKIVVSDDGDAVHVLRPSARWRPRDDKLTEWWIERCGLDVALDGDYLSKGVHLTPLFFRRLTHMWRCEEVKAITWSTSFTVALRELSVSNVVFVDMATRHPASVAGLHSLSLHGADAGGLACAQALRHLTHLRLRTNVTALDMSRFASAASLTSFELVAPQLASIGGFHRCTALCSVVFSTCERLTSMSACGDAPGLERFHAYSCSVTDISGLHRCRQLKEVSLCSCLALRDARPLGGLPLLAVLNLSRSGVEDIAGLGRCLSLERVDFSNCANLRDLSPLAGAPALTILDARNSGAAVVTGLHLCGSLERVNFDDCRSLQTLSPLGGAPRLGLVSARDSGLRDVAGLAACPQLTQLDVLKCEHLVSLSAGCVGGDPAPVPRHGELVNARHTFATCQKLEYLNVGICSLLQSLSPLAGAPNLRQLVAMSTAIRDVQGLERCPRLQKLDLASCEGLSWQCKAKEIPRLRSAGVICVGI